VLLTLDNVEKKVSVTIFLHVEKVGPLAYGGLGGKHLSAYTHLIIL
jgi:hypothetical protein